MCAGLIARLLEEGRHFHHLTALIREINCRQFGIESPITTE